MIANPRLMRARISPPPSTNAIRPITSTPASTASPISVQRTCSRKKPQSTAGSREYTWWVGSTPITAAQTMNPAATSASKSVSITSVGVSVA